MSNTLENTYVDDLEQIKRLRRAKEVQTLSINHDTHEGIFKGSSKKNYSTTLNACTCRDFIVRKQPCKHIYKLALELGVIDFPDNINSLPTAKSHTMQVSRKEITYKKKFKANTNSFIAIDLETTGVSYRVDKIIEIGALKVIGGKIVDTFVSLINPGIPIPPDATHINRITNAMVNNQPTFKDIFPSFVTFIEDLPLVAHNAPFDAKFLVSAFNNFDTELPNQFIDTLSISRKFFPNSPNHKLATLNTYLDLNGYASHRALDDAYVTYLLYMKCFEVENNTTINKLSPFPLQTLITDTLNSPQSQTTSTDTLSPAQSQTISTDTSSLPQSQTSSIDTLSPSQSQTSITDTLSLSQSQTTSTDTLSPAQSQTLVIDTLSPPQSQATTATEIPNNNSSTINTITQLENCSEIVDNKSQKNKITAIILCLLLGVIGIHRFYVGKHISGIIFLLTGGIGGLGIIFDLILLLRNQFTDKDGKHLT